MLFRNDRTSFPRREQLRQPLMVFGIIGARVGNEPLFGDLFQPDFARPRQWMRQIDRNTNGVTMKLFENESAHVFRRQLNHESDVQFAVVQSRSEEHTSELQSPCNLVCRLLLEKKKKNSL